MNTQTRNEQHTHIMDFISAIVYSYKIGLGPFNINIGLNQNFINQSWFIFAKIAKT